MLIVMVFVIRLSVNVIITYKDTVYIPVLIDDDAMLDDTVRMRYVS